MSAVVKMHPTEKVSIKVGQKHAEIFYLPKDAADNLLLFVKNCQPVKSQDSELIKLDDESNISK